MKCINFYNFRSAIFLPLIVLIFTASVFAQSGGVKGKVRTSSGAGISGAIITARKDGKDVLTARSDAQGKFQIDGLESGSYNIVFDAYNYSSGILYNVEIRKNNVRDLGDRLILFPDQGTQVIVKGSVFYKEGTSVTGAKVELEKVNPDGTTKKLGSVYTNVSGEFTFRQPEASAKLRVIAKFKGVTGTREVDVDTAAIYRLAITLDISRTEK